MKDFVVHNHLKEMCSERGISVAELSRQAGMEVAGIYRGNNYTLNTIAKFLIILDCKFEDLFEIVEQ